jgi:hypothetical protein
VVKEVPRGTILRDSTKGGSICPTYRGATTLNY